MKKLIIIYLILSTSQVLAYQLKTTWNSKLQKIITIKCEGDASCQQFCGGKQECATIETYCRSCIGNDPYVTSVFSGMGQLFRNAGEEVSSEEFFTFLNSRNFVSFTSKSVYNNIERFNSKKLQQRFQSLCPIETEYPIVFFNIDPIGHNLGKVQYVLCNGPSHSMEIFKMTNDTSTVIDLGNTIIENY